MVYSILHMDVSSEVNFKVSNVEFKGDCFNSLPVTNDLAILFHKQDGQANCLLWALG